MTGRALLGAVLAGGASRRFGRDKAAEDVGGLRMIERAVRSLKGVCSDVIVVSARSDTPTGPWRTVPDLRPGLGPLAAIETALTHASDNDCSEVLLLACDLPLVSEVQLSGLLDEYDGTTAVAMGRSGVPGFEPLCAVYPVTLLPQATGLLDRGELAARSLFPPNGRIVGPPEGEEPLHMINVNTPEDAARARAALESGDVE